MSAISTVDDLVSTTQAVDHVHQRMLGVDGLRGLAVLSVLVYHFHLFAVGAGNASWQRAYNFACGFGWAGVDLFFVLSGFLITGILLKSAGQPHYYRNFYFRRTVRIFPLYYASLALFYGVTPVILGMMHRADLIQEWVKPSSQGYAWLYIMNWSVGISHPAPEALQHFWSLSIEEQFYLVWPLLVLTVRDRIFLMCVALFAGSLLFRVYFYQIGMDYAGYVLTVCRLDSLAIGAMIAVALQSERYWTLAKLIAPWLTAAAALALLATIALTRSTSFRDAFMGTAGITFLDLFFGGCVIMTVAAKEGSLIYQLTSSKPLRFLGKYSYGIYVFHQPLIIWLAGIGMTSQNITSMLGSPLAAVLVVNAAGFLLTVLAALVSWNLIERPFLDLRDRLQPNSPGVERSCAVFATAANDETRI